MVLNHTNSGTQPHQSPYQAMALTRTTDRAHRSQYSGTLIQRYGAVVAVRLTFRIA